MSEHEENCECFICKNGPEKARQWEEKCMKSHGWYCHFIFDDKDSPYNRNVHSHGVLESFDHPDFQVMGAIHAETCHHIIAGVIDQVKDGKKFKSVDKLGNIVNDTMDILFIDAKECGRDVLRIILPDPDGNVDADKIDSKWVGQYRDTDPTGF